MREYRKKNREHHRMWTNADRAKKRLQMQSNILGIRVYYKVLHLAVKSN